MDTFFTNRPHPSMRSLKDFSPLSSSVRSHLINVYATLTVGMFIASFGVIANIYYGINLGILTFFATIGFLIALASTPASPDNSFFRASLFGAICLTQGLSLGPLIDLVLYNDPAILVNALVGTSLVFASFTASALLSPRRDYIFLGGILSSALSVMFWLSIFNIFVGSLGIFNVQLYLGLFVMCGFVLYDTQLIVEKASRGDRDHVWHAVDLFIDFVGIFVRLLIILSKNSNGRREDKRRR